jgi:RimK family alpha-L-glutamate ligase
MLEALYIENAFWQSSATRWLRQTLMQAAEEQGMHLQVRSNADFLRNGSLEDLPPLALFWDKDVRLAGFLEAKGLRLFNQAEAIRICDDKTLTYIALQNLDVPMPDTLLCPTTFPAVGYTRFDFIRDAAEQLGIPFVIKEGFGSFGQQVYLVHTLEEAQDLIQAAAGKPLLFQRFIRECAGRDVRAYVVGGEVVASMMRVNTSGDFRANIASGGQAHLHTLSAEEKRIALAACRHLRLDFAGVDLLESDNGPLLCEVNSNAHFQALRELCGRNPADNIIGLLKAWRA